MESLINQKRTVLEEMAVLIHKKLELRKMHINRLRSGTVCPICQSFCHELGLQKQTNQLITKYQW